MTKSNEYNIKGGSFDDAAQAVDILNSLLNEVRHSGEKTTKQRVFRANVSGLQECIGEIIRGARGQWRESGIEDIFLHRKEDVAEKKYALKLSFEHPLYEYVWLTDKDGHNIGEELIPFLEYTVEYLREAATVRLSHSMIDAKLNLPDFKTSLEATRRDPGLLRAEAERVGKVVKAATLVQGRFTAAIRDFCNKNELKVELVAANESPTKLPTLFVNESASERSVNAP